MFDCPNMRAYGDLELPGVVDAQITAFAHELACHESEAAYYASQGDDKPKFSSQSFIPTGLFGAGGGKAEVPEAHANFAGHVVEAATYKNALTGLPFFWALVDTVGARFDVVVDPDLLTTVPVVGNVVAGSFWLSGRLTNYKRRQPGWFGKLRRGTT